MPLLAAQRRRRCGRQAQGLLGPKPPRGGWLRSNHREVEHTGCAHAHTAATLATATNRYIQVPADLVQA
jgi:hypothetical protein